MCGEFFVSGGEAAELLEQIELAFHQVAGFVAMAIIGPEILAIGSWRDDRGRVLRLNPLDQRVGVVAAVAGSKERTLIAAPRGHRELPDIQLPLPPAA